MRARPGEPDRAGTASIASETGGGERTAIGLDPRARAAVAAVLACERPAGGWRYACDPRLRSTGVTSIMIHASRAAGALGLASWDLAALRSPGTPAAGLLMLEAYDRGAGPQALEAARRAGDLLVSIQLPNDGWLSEMPVYGTSLARWFLAVAPWATLDDDVVTGSVRLLLALWRRTADERYRRAAERGLDLLLRSQLPGGAWPLTWRPRLRRWLRPTFEDLPSLNDAATTAVIETLIEAAEALGRPELLRPARRAGEWLLRVRSPGRGWAQQYSVAGRPVPGRRFEPAALATWESRHVLEALDALARATGDRRYCEPFPEVVAWLERIALAPGCWARFHSLDDDRPVYLDREGRRVTSEAQAKRPYRWTGDYGIPFLLERVARDRGERPAVAGPAPAPWRIAGEGGRCPHHGRPWLPPLDSPNARVRMSALGTLLATGRPPPATYCSVLAPGA